MDNGGKADNWGLCGCGCKQPTTIAKYDDPSRGAKRGEPRRFIFGHAARIQLWRTGKASHAWKGGVSPYRGKLIDGKHKGEHVLIAEKALGHSLPKGVLVHHIDENKKNNANSNLLICPAWYHNLLHLRLRALRACGDPSWRKCVHCKKWDDTTNLYIWAGGRQKKSTVCLHPICGRAYQQHWRDKQKEKAKGR